ncbi:MAG: hypothetical protein MK135_15335, partial [Polyangiaceae bacterium]|nr:hypothetical protein [Polyangiaceae bacterium]
MAGPENGPFGVLSYAPGGSAFHPTYDMSTYSSFHTSLALALSSLFALAAGCSSFPQFAEGTDGGVRSGSGDGSSEPGSGDQGGLDIDPSEGGGSMGDGSGFVEIPCGNLQCTGLEKCVSEGGEERCVAKTCADLLGVCAATEVCDESSSEGAFCADITCSSDLDCASAEYCDSSTGLCAGTVCESDQPSCADGELSVCSSNGSAAIDLFACGGGHTEFADACVAPTGSEDFGCKCYDDWDCPAFTRCEPTTLDTLSSGEGQLRVGLCTGTGTEPSCRLPLQPFSADNTVQEIQWGSITPGPDGVFERLPNAADPDTPYSDYVQVVMAPVVANLDDDNGDGWIDERDVPEIIFHAMKGSQFQVDGVLRAIHGGTARRGKDYFAYCTPNEYWNESDLLAGNSGFVEGDGTCTTAESSIDPSTGIAVGDLNYDGIPEIVAVSTSNAVLIFDNQGRKIADSTSDGMGAPHRVGAAPQVGIANVDQEGWAEITIGSTVFSLGEVDDGQGNQRIGFLHWFRSTGTDNSYSPMGSIPCVADIDPIHPGMEIVVGGRIYGMPEKPAGVTSQGAACQTAAELVNPGVQDPWCNRQLPLLTTARAANGAAIGNAFCAIADVWGASTADPPSPSNPLDGQPELVLVLSGKYYIIDPTDGSNIAEGSQEASSGPPNIDDFDGDGFPEMGTATARQYQVIDFQPPSENCPSWPERLDPDNPGVNPNLTLNNADPTVGGARSAPGGTCQTHAQCPADMGCNQVTNTCSCLHNGWFSETEDDSSKVT